MITWRPIAELPDELKDGRQVLLWDKDEPRGYEAGVASFSNLGGGLGGWRNDEFVPIPNPTHFAEINAPGSQRTMEQQMDSTREGYREQGRQARRDGLTIADCPAFPSIPPRPIGHVEHGTEWIKGWHEQDALLTRTP